MKKRLYGDDLLTRAELGKALKKSKTTIRRWEAEGKLKPTINERGVRLYRAADVKSLDPSAVIEPLPQARSHVQSAAQASGDLAAEVFARLERGEGAVKIVAELRVHPDVVDGLMKRWARFKRAIFLSREDVYAIEEHLGMRVREFTAECLVDRIRRIAERMTKCMNCKKEPPYMCSTCVSIGSSDAIGASMVRSTFARRVSTSACARRSRATASRKRQKKTRRERRTRARTKTLRARATLADTCGRSRSGVLAHPGCGSHFCCASTYSPSPPSTRAQAPPQSRRGSRNVELSLVLLYSRPPHRLRRSAVRYAHSVERLPRWEDITARSARIRARQRERFRTRCPLRR